MTASGIGRREGGLAQGWTLVACAWLSVMANMVISPILPSMTAHFSGVPQVDLLISLAATSPAFFVAVLAIPAGYLGHRIGHERVLLWAAMLYGIAGVAPFFLDDLGQIVASRALVGIAEAAVMTCSTALIGDYFLGTRRERYLALQTGTSPVVAIVAVTLGGLAGNADWHNSFFIYGFAFVLVVAVLAGLRRGRADVVAAEPAPRESDPRGVNWFNLGWICIVTVFAMTAFLVTIIQLPFLLTERGVPEPRMIGFLAGAATMANPLGALFFSFTRFRMMVKLTVAFAMLGAGFGTMALSADWHWTLVGAVLANFGAGTILPLLITWALAALPDAQRGVGTGAWISASFLGQFLRPLVILVLKGITGSLSGAVLVYALACGVSALLALLASLAGRQGTKTVAAA